jgi:hypothetical protein
MSRPLSFVVRRERGSMFLVNKTPEFRAGELRKWLATHPSVAVLVSAAYFEWTVSRAVIALSRRSNAEIREALKSVFGLDKYKRLWRDELRHLEAARSLPQVVADWQSVVAGFDARNRLIHGRTRYTRNMATPAVEALLAAVADVMAYSTLNGVDLNSRLPVRRKPGMKPEEPHQARQPAARAPAQQLGGAEATSAEPSASADRGRM